ncbi:MAG: hypothetical protein J7J01_01150 [Methanophagales archaeon]|nr:hypothetical protein [Methanophagales archaeon]
MAEVKGFLSSVRDALIKGMEEAWSTVEGEKLGDLLEAAAKEAGIAGDKGRYARAAAEGYATRDYKRIAAEIRLGDRYREVWEAAPEDLGARVRADLRFKAHEAWDLQSRKALTRMVRRLNIHKLYKLCASGRFEDVAAEIGGPIPSNMKECYARVAEAKKLDEAMENAWYPEEEE